MGKFDRYDQYQEMRQKPKRKVHPIWAGIGCLMLIILPVVAFAAADTLYNQALGSGLSLFGTMLLPSSGVIYRVYFTLPLWGDTVLRFTMFHLLFILVFSIVGFMIYSLVYSVVYRITGPPKYGPTDAPPPRRIRKRRR